MSDSCLDVIRSWLPRRRWYAGKGRPIEALTLVAATEVLPYRGSAPGLLHLLVDVRPPGDCYQLLLGIREALPPELAPALIGRPTTGPLRGTAVYEALQDPRLTSLLLERLATPGSLGRLRFSQTERWAAPPARPTPRPLDAEQSNSSVIYGNAAILKLFRRVEPGINPDLELTYALARQGSPHVPAPLAWFESTADVGDRTLGILQPYLAGTLDGWQLALRALARGADFTAAAHALGRTTARVHTGLAEALPTGTLTGPELMRTAEGMAGRLEAAGAAVPALRPYRAALLETFRALAALGARGRGLRAQRVHGDLHLGQALARGGGTGAEDWTLIDFEGEPARPLSERRAPQPVERDIAGMLRSFDYAACQGPAAGAESARARAWAAANRAAYCAGYAEACGRDPREEAVLLRAYETDKAVYEVLYEARNRPAWLGIPLSAVRRLAAPSSAPSA
ncbi:maltokinase N-terminal cap-like domain-containing protein [Streptomyces spirodelae]|uniref:maltokinase N-terminal cap-like domain-containing protein n=1 Tax=Streptomyces spirodelae TaxID=2812904 RepID=UPI0027DCC0F0|nr:phosphotransferase [Streptomyces spirodelae]